MAAKSGRNARVEENQMATKVDIWELISEFKALKPDLKTKFLAVKKEVTDLKERVCVRVSLRRSKRDEDRPAELHGTERKRERQRCNLNWMIQGEKARRNNISVFRQSLNSEEGKPIWYVKTLIAELLNLSCLEEVKVEKVHLMELPPPIWP